MLALVNVDTPTLVWYRMKIDHAVRACNIGWCTIIIKWTVSNTANMEEYRLIDPARKRRKSIVSWTLSVCYVVLNFSFLWIFSYFLYCPTPTIANAVIYGVLNLKQFGSITAQEAEQQISLVAVINKKNKKASRRSTNH